MMEAKKVSLIQFILIENEFIHFNKCKKKIKNCNPQIL